MAVGVRARSYKGFKESAGLGKVKFILLLRPVKILQSLVEKALLLNLIHTRQDIAQYVEPCHLAEHAGGVLHLHYLEDLLGKTGAGDCHYPVCIEYYEELQEQRNISVYHDRELGGPYKAHRILLEYDVERNYRPYNAPLEVPEATHKIDDLLSLRRIVKCIDGEVPANTVMFSVLFNRDAKLAVTLVSLSTLLSLFTMPLVISLAMSV